MTDRIQQQALVPDRLGGERLDQVAAQLFPDYSRSRLQAWIRKGELLGYIVSAHRPTIRAVVSQGDIGLVRERLTKIEVRLTEQPTKSSPATSNRFTS